MSYKIKLKSPMPERNFYEGVLAHVGQLEENAREVLLEGDVDTHEKAFTLCEYLDLCDEVEAFTLCRRTYNGSVQGLSDYLATAPAQAVCSLLNKSWAAQTLCTLSQAEDWGVKLEQKLKRLPAPKALAA